MSEAVWAKTNSAHYRPDIDGLRALAVLAVVAFHYELGLPSAHLWIRHAIFRPSGTVYMFAPGGFVGVDVFFVISGYLIGGILLREQERNGRISLRRFYERRIRRIGPAFAGMLVCTSVGAWFALLPTQVKDYAKSTIAAVLSISNIYFWKKTGYFDAPAQFQPLLHTWSLAVEEQFYLVLPLVMLVLRGCSTRWKAGVLSVLAALSFAYSGWLLQRDPSGAFYFPLSRAWELLSGVLLAMGLLPKLRTDAARNACAGVGLGLIAYAIVRMTAQTRFPGAAALLPCVGAVLLIAAGEHGGCHVSRWIGCRALRAVGLVSYSLYLWHWPLLMASRDEWFAGWVLPPQVLLALLAAVTYVSWRFIEQPFRVGHLHIARANLFACTAVFATMLLAVSGWVAWTGGWGWRHDARMRALDSTLDHSAFTTFWRSECFLGVGATAVPHGCIGEDGQRADALLFGDSQMAQLWNGLRASFPEARLDVATGSSCRPLLRSMSGPADYCRMLTQQVFEKTLPNGRERTVLLASVWEMADIPALDATLKRLSDLGLRVYVFGPSTYYDQALPVLLYRAERSGRPDLPARHLVYPPSYYEALEAGIRHAARYPGVTYVSLRQEICPGGDDQRCATYVPGKLLADGGREPLMFDIVHLTPDASVWLTGLLKSKGLLSLPQQADM